MMSVYIFGYRKRIKTFVKCRW